MATTKREQTARLDLNDITKQVEFGVGRGITATVQVTDPALAAGTAVVTLYRSNDRVGWVALENGGITLTMSGGTAMSDEFDVSGFMYLAARVTTVEGSAAEADVHVVQTEDV